MNATTCLWRPIGGLKAALRQTPQQRLLTRSMATAAKPRASLKPSKSSKPSKPAKPSTPARSKIETEKPWINFRPAHKPRFLVYKPVSTVRDTYKDPMPTLDAKQRAKLDPLGNRARLFDRAREDAAKVGDVLMVSTKSGEPFSGVCMSIRRRGVDTAILLRSQLMKVGVEMWFKIYSPTVVGVDIVWRRPKRARRARLTYMRKPKHDMGNVDHLVYAWKKERYGKRAKGRRIGSRFDEKKATL